MTNPCEHQLVSTPLKTVRVELGERGYDILIGKGALNEAGERIAALVPGARAVIITDGRVARLHLDALEASLNAAGIDSFAAIVPPGETSKSWHGVQTVTDAILGGRLERGDLVIALGGGVIGDLAGFAAAIARRGMRFVQVPTTLRRSIARLAVKPASIPNTARTWLALFISRSLYSPIPIRSIRCPTVK